MSSLFAQGPVLTVCPDSSGDYLTIQAAVDAAPAGAVIELCDGLYTGAGNRDIVLGDRFLTIRSASGDPDACVIDCGGTELEPHRGFLFQTAAGVDTCAVIEGVTIRNGWAAGGGGIRCESIGEDGGGPLLRNCRVEDCEGGGIAVEEAGLRLQDCSINGNGGGNLLLVSGFCRADGSEFSGGSGDGIGLGGGPDAVFAILRMRACRVTGNQGHGLALGAWWEVYADSCTFQDNGGRGVHGAGAESGYAGLTDCRMLGNSAGGVLLGEAAWGRLTDCQVTGNGLGTGGPGLIFSFAFGQSATRCEISQNAGDGLRLGWGSKRPLAKSDPIGPVIDCTILDNGGWGIAGGGYLFDLEVSGTLIAGNASGGCTFALEADAPAAPAFRSSTIVANDGPGVEIASSQPVTIDNTIIAFNLGEAIAMPLANVPALSCSDLYGNASGDWAGPLAAQLGLDGNFSADPLFCNAASFDFHLAADSPAAADQAPGACGLVGALPVGCAAGFGITSVADIPGDQGLRVRVIWWGHPDDAPGAGQPIARYLVWRRVEGTLQVPGREGGDLAPAALLPGDPVRLWAHAALWEPVGPEVPGMGWPQYASVVPTLADSAAAGIAWSVFMVSAHTADPRLFFLSAPDSGYSVDNLTPAAPLGFAAAYSASGNLLQWQPHIAPDFVAFRIYRGEGTSFPLSQATLVQTTDDTQWTDVISTPWRWGYLITAVDDSGLESAAAMPAVVTDVPGTPALPLHPVLHGAAPNPFNPRTKIDYALPAGGAEVRLEIFDVRGRRLRLLTEGFQEPGRHEAVWDGTDAQGRFLPTGIYFCRLRAAGVSEVTKLSLVR